MVYSIKKNEVLCSVKSNLTSNSLYLAKKMSKTDNITSLLRKILINSQIIFLIDEFSKSQSTKNKLNSK